jgi:hypothetical protein
MDTFTFVGGIKSVTSYPHILGIVPMEGLWSFTSASTCHRGSVRLITLRTMPVFMPEAARGGDYQLAYGGYAWFPPV